MADSRGTSVPDDRDVFVQIERPVFGGAGTEYQTHSVYAPHLLPAARRHAIQLRRSYPGWGVRVVRETPGVTP